jgi:hydrogenase-4 component B
VLGILCVAIGLAPVLFWTLVAPAVAVWHPDWAGVALPAPLIALSVFHLGLTAVAMLGAIFLWRRVKRNGLQRAVTWDCGYAAPTARMQYTAGSFAGIINEWFDWILRRERHEQRPEENFPQHAHQTEHTPETVLEKVVEPIATAVLNISAVASRLQHGRVQAYLLYLLIGIALLGVLVVMGGAQ